MSLKHIVHLYLESFKYLQLATSLSCFCFHWRAGFLTSPYFFILFSSVYWCDSTVLVFTSCAPGSLKTSGSSSVGMLDLGGGSTQITFLPRVQVTSPTLQGCLPVRRFIDLVALGTRNQFFSWSIQLMPLSLILTLPRKKTRNSVFNEVIN